MLSKLRNQLDFARRAAKTLSGRRQLLPVDDSFVESWYQLPPEERARRNLEVIDKRLIRFGGLKRRSARRKLGQLGGFQVVFFHIPKTGGTTLEYLVTKNYQVDSLQHLNAPELDFNPSRACRQGELVRVLMGHYETNEIFYQWLNRKFVHFTMLREPVSRLLSYYDYLQTSPNHPLFPLAKDMSLETFVTSTQVDEQSNAQTHRLLGLLRGGAHQRVSISDEAKLEQAKTMLRQRFSLFGITEEYDAFLVMARRLLGWPDIFYTRKNVSRKKTRLEDLPDNTLALIKQSNAIDVELYRYARRLFRQRCKQLELTNEAVQQFREANKQHCDLLNVNY